MPTVTLQDIAEKAGVSITTVHRVFSNKTDVSSSTSKRIIAIAKDLGYNFVRKGVLIQKLPGDLSGISFRTGTIGFLLFASPLELIKRNINMKLLSYLEAAFAKYGLLMTVIQVPEADKLPEIVSQDRLDGIIFLGCPETDQVKTKLAEIHSISLLGSDFPGLPWVDVVTSDYFQRAYIAADYLARRGHKNVAFINLQSEHKAFEMVSLFFSLEAEKKGLTVENYLGSVKSLPSVSEGVPESVVDEAMADFFARPADKRPTGFFVANDETSLSIYRCLRKHGIEPMKDVDIISCDNDDTILPQLAPKPATMDLNLEVIAQRVAEKLFFRIKNPDALCGVKTLIPPRLVLPEHLKVSSIFTKN